MMRSRFLFILLTLPLLVWAQMPEPPLEIETAKPQQGPFNPPLPQDKGQPSPPSNPLFPRPSPPENTSNLPVPKDQEPFRPNPQAGEPKLAGPPPQKGTVNVEFRGRKAFPEEEMRTAIADVLKDMESQGLSNALADDAAFFLANHYRERGYSQAEVAYETRANHLLVLKISEGPLSRVGRITISGNRQIAQPTLLDYLLGPAHERFPKEKNNPPFVEADLENGVGWIRAFYASQGFPNAVVDAPKYNFLRVKSTVDVEVHVTEGTKFTIGEISFSGDLIFPTEQLLKQLGDLSTKPYTNQEINRLQQVLEYYYKTKGYFNASVSGSSDLALAVNGRVPASFAIQPGEQYRFDDITVAGLIKLKPDFLPKRFKKLSGQIYNPELVQNKVREMTRTGLFKSFRLHEEPLPDRTVRLDITVEEAKAKELGFLLGYTTYEGGIVGASYRDRNLFGEGRPLTTNAQYSTRGLRGEILYSDPWFLNDTLILRLRLYALTQRFDGYSKLEEGIRGEIARKITDKLEVSAFLLARNVELQDVLISPDLRDELAHVHGKERAQRRARATEDLVGPTSYTVNSIGLSENLDTRDSKINPTKGYFFNSTIDSAADALGSQVNFIRATVAGSYYLPLGKIGLLAFGARAGIIDPLHERGSIPIDERFFNGGSLSVRSFTERHLGPKDRNGFPVGGDSFTVFNVEYDFPIQGELEGATFLDAGSLGSGNSFGEMRYGVGVGLRYRLPIGPLRLDYAVNPSRKPDESIGAFHFSFGFAF